MPDWDGRRSRHRKVSTENKGIWAGSELNICVQFFLVVVHLEAGLWEIDRVK